MKKIIIIMIGFLFFFESCSSQTYLDKGTLDSLLNSRSFTFMAEKAIPTNNDAIQVLNSLPGTTSSQITNLSYGYTVVVNKGILVAHLPYFGRVFTPSRDPEKAGIQFTSKDFTYTESTGKKGKRIITISPNDVEYVGSLNFEVYSNGSAYLSINTNDRQPISYNGYLMKNEMVKK